jgi:tetratricopeptide (TPR) repeat protein
MARAHQNLGALLKSLGDMDAARSAYLRAVDIEPDMTGAWRALAEMRKYASADDADIAYMTQVHQRQDLDRSQQANICFALGKAYDDLEDYDTAFAYYAEGNAAQRQQVKPNMDRQVGELRRFRRSIDASVIARWRGAGDPDPTPIFILGMPRSGTTLTEQILASHPKVEGGGELYDLARTFSGVGKIAGLEGAFPDWLAEIDETGLKRLGRAYVDAIREGRENATFITDKMPANFRFVGLIRMILPNAKIIHTRRHPGDTCLSCYTKLFTEGQEFTYNLSDLGRYYRAYDELMAHWRAVLPPGDILEVGYERLVSDMEAQTRRLLDFCGLEWDDACLRFHENKRSVATASVMQVRRPVYTSSVQRWQRYRRHLDPLFQAMGQGFKESGPE